MKHFKTFIYILAGFGMVSCNPKLYTPNTHNVPLISEKGQTNLTLSGNGNQVEFQGAYGIAENIAIQASGGLFIPSDLNNGNGGSGKFLEVGGGYFKPISDVWVFEAYGLIGIGSVENHLPSTISKAPLTNGDISANILRVGVQPNFGYVSKYFSAAVSSRFVNLSYSNIEGDLVFNNDILTDYLKENNSNFLIEPALTVRAGFEKVKLQLQYTHSLNLSNSNFRQDQGMLTIGLNFNFQ
ncbi:MAG: hypothetical protein ABI263_09100 [Gelidibacter sp.]